MYWAKTDEAFWKIIDAAHDVDMAERTAQLKARLTELTLDDVRAFAEIWSRHHVALYDWRVWGVAYLVQGGCSDDAFMDWRDWLISCGQSAVETALNNPDDLVPLIQREPEHGVEGIGYIPSEVLEKKSGSPPAPYGATEPDQPTGPAWKEGGDDLKLLLPKTYAAFSEQDWSIPKRWWQFWK